MFMKNLIDRIRSVTRLGYEQAIQPFFIKRGHPGPIAMDAAELFNLKNIIDRKIVGDIGEEFK
jgi:hypothetical protein